MNQRADARRNHGLLLEAAVTALAQSGIDVPAQEIAHRAGVAKGTLFRHFATKEQLVAAVLADRFAQLRTLVAELAADPDPGLATIARLMESAAAVVAADRSFFDAATCAAVTAPELQHEKAALAHELDALVARTQAGGEVRCDIVGADIAMLVMAATNTCAPTDELAPELWRRYLALMIDSLRAGTTTPLPVPPLQPLVSR
ncbi:MAG: helix-turn-helix domain-containing protein [Solirubrobacteraceae bacterium]